MANSHLNLKNFHFCIPLMSLQLKMSFAFTSTDLQKNPVIFSFPPCACSTRGHSLFLQSLSVRDVSVVRVLPYPVSEGTHVVLRDDWTWCLVISGAPNSVYCIDQESELIFKSGAIWLSIFRTSFSKYYDVEETPSWLNDFWWHYSESKFFGLCQEVTREPTQARGGLTHRLAMAAA